MSPFLNLIVRFKGSFGPITAVGVDAILVCLDSSLNGRGVGGGLGWPSLCPNMSLSNYKGPLVTGA